MLRGAIKRFFSCPSGVHEVTVIGSGQMGTGIAFVLSSVAQKKVKMIDVSEERLSFSNSFCEGLLDKEIKRGKLTPEGKSEIMNRFSYSVKLEDAQSSDHLNQRHLGDGVEEVHPDHFFWPLSEAR